jgi:hypothetical protein
MLKEQPELDIGRLSHSLFEALGVSPRCVIQWKALLRCRKYADLLGAALINAIQLE